MGIDPNIYDRAEETCKADHPQSTAADVRRLAEAWQREYEYWASQMDVPCDCGHGWELHKRQPNGAYGCTSFGCGCCDAVLP